MTNDPVLEEVRRVRKLISNEIGPNVVGLVEHYAKYDSSFEGKAIEATDRRTNRL